MKEALCFFGMIGAASQRNYKSMQFNIKKHKKYEEQRKQMGACEQTQCYNLSVRKWGFTSDNVSITWSFVDLSYSESIEKEPLLIYFSANWLVA